MRQKRVYIDTNVFVYVAIKHPEFYRRCREVIELLVNEEYEGYGSQLVLFELFGSLSRLNALAAYEAVMAYLDLPIRILNINRGIFPVARDIARLSGTTYDAVHAALAVQNQVEIVVTEDLNDWTKIAAKWNEIQKIHNVSKLLVYSPTRGLIKPQK